MVEVGTGTAGTKIVKTNYPVEEGTTAGTTKLKESPNLIAEERLTKEDKRAGL